MRNFVLLPALAALPLLLGATSASAKEGNTNPPQTIMVETTSFYDETAYDWPGTASTGKPRVDTLKINPGLATSPALPFGDCVFIDNNTSNEEVPLSFTTAEDWDKFKKNPPVFLTLTACCPRKTVANPCSPTAKTITADKVAMIRTLSYGDVFLQVFQCAPVDASHGEWKLIGENFSGSCPRAPTNNEE